MNAVVRCANRKDMNDLISFLVRANVGTDGIEQLIENFLIMEDESGHIKATMGIEPYGDVGLLRSLVMAPTVSERQLFILFKQMLHLAEEKEINEVFLATNKQGAVMLVEFLGFQRVVSDEIPKRLLQSEHIQHILTVDNSVFLKLSTKSS
jgi:N-acetylglutamate synthase-like GNAT family acetyltransferase